jgi:FkbM family methyltransferase
MVTPTGPVRSLTQFSIPGGVQVIVPADPELMTPFVLDEQGDWFESEMQFVRSLLTPAMVVVDVGANYGVYTLTCAGLVGHDGRVTAYEPASLPRSCLARSIEVNGFSQVRLIGVALSDRSGTARLGIASNAELNSLNESGEAGETVTLSTLDTEALNWDRPVDFLKLDAEGEELRILMGAKSFFATHDPLVMFEHKHGATVNHGLTQAFRDLGRSVYRLLPGLNVLVPMPADGTATEPYLLNIFGCCAERAARLAGQGLLVQAPATIAPPLAADEAIRAVLNWFCARPWARVLMQQTASGDGTEADGMLAVANSDLILGDDSRRPIAERWAHQLRGYARLRKLIVERPTIPRLFSAARVAMDLGDRAASVTMLELAESLIGNNTAQDSYRRECFLPPHRRYDDFDPGYGTAASLIQMMVTEPLLERCAFSIYFAADRVVPLLRRISANPLRSDAMDRRLNAARKVLSF